jgi:chromosome segregation protein
VRLTQIKLAGFKSFVDPTHVNVPGDLVGVVGPNGCGKSNIIDAVRWVLGESRASALRGDSMQDVIFNGSTLRKPVARASVELIFDNSLGKAAGQWSQYAEISVKRVLTRDNESSYLINNTQVRRRDIHDIFLGTGLGPRAYAIIEQGMISRIIEAKPEELRVFLEEAAGVSKYKERRKETENRLADTRENLSRVADIRQELGNQIEKLERQAEVARRFNELSTERQQKQNLLWVLRRQEAEAEENRHRREMERGTNELEAETARLRDTEKQLELAREEHYAAGDALTASQGELYAANSEVARLETEIRFVAETRQRLEAQLGQLRMQRENGERQRTELEGAIAMWRQRLDEARERALQAQQRAEEEKQRMPGMEQALREARARLDAERSRLVELERAFELEQTHGAHADRVLQGLAARQERLQSEQAELEEPDTEALAALHLELEQSAAEMARQRGLLDQVEAARGVVDAQRAAALQRVQGLEREQSTLDGRLQALQRIQSQVDENGRIHDWIERWQLGAKPRLWQKIRVEDGWDAAVEAVLRDRLHAVEITDPGLLQNLLDEPPPARLSALTPFSFGESEPAQPEYGLKPLLEYVTLLDETETETWRPLLSAWLGRVYAVESMPGNHTRMALPVDALLVTREGHQFGRYAVSFHAPDSADSGILARQREIEALTAEVGKLGAAIQAAKSEQQGLEASLSEHDEALAKLRAAGSALRQRDHERRVEQVKLVQSDERYRERSAQIADELAEIAGQQAAEHEARATAAEALERHRQDIAATRASLLEVSAAHDAAAQSLDGQRNAIAQAEREAQEAAFSEKECVNKIEEIERMLQAAAEQMEAAAVQLETLAQELAELHDEGLKEQLQSALSLRVDKEQQLATARTRQDEAAAALRALDEARMGSEQKLEPLRERIADLRLKEQAARLNMEQFAGFLAEAGVDEAAIAALLAEVKEGQRASPLQGEITRLNNAIAELGAINMAALDELQTSTERKSFLDSQAEDLGTALETLENAIRKIDRETRELLQSTFDTVNDHFSQLFPALFGGGEARLSMTGEEILDAGVQVMARPPGKKNSTIHLLSGGEKALTAISLVFSFFQLNPAPFCLLDEVDAPLDDANTGRFCELVRRMSRQTQFLYISHNKITMEMASHLVGVTMQEQGVSRVVAVDIDEALRLREPVAA